ncbi:hypothetical protein BDF14DRAFT_1836393 [Spinellus fusiger]|nr:hypothetical protein BDF14DRAFT_1836393 [Spinellus fusiger]
MPLHLHGDKQVTHSPLAYSATPPMAVHVQTAQTVQTAQLILHLHTPSSLCTTCTLPGHTDTTFYCPTAESIVNEAGVPLWTLTAGGESLVFTSAHSILHLTNSAFQTGHQSYHWQWVRHTTGHYDLHCYHSHRHTPVCELTHQATRFVLWSLPATRPNSTATGSLRAKSMDQQRLSMPNAHTKTDTGVLEDPLTSFLVLSGLFLYHHSPPLPTLTREIPMVDTDSEYQQDDSSTSVRSLEITPVWWQHGWRWCPCCMPGGWCDGAWISWRQAVSQCFGRPSRAHDKRQGWQQQTE